MSFKQSEYWVKESDGRVAITILADRRYFNDSFYVKIRVSVNRDLKPYGTHKCVCILYIHMCVYVRVYVYIASHCL